MKRLFVFVLLGGFLIGGCALAGPTVGEATPGPALSPTELKYRILDEFPDFFFCDPDFYPIAREDELTLAQQRFPDVQADPEVFGAILAHTGLAGASSFSPDQQLLIYRAYKKLNAIAFESGGDRFQFQIQTGTEGQAGSLVTGLIDGSGAIEVQARSESFLTCPICLAAGTRISTPRGAIPVEALRVGDPVWTVNAAGERVAGTILQAGSVRVPATHQVIHLVLSDGRELWASPGHPLADGRRLANLAVGDPLEGAQVSVAERLPYGGLVTYDLLPSGPTGLYWAEGILLGSTLQVP